jgi:hypothetical protein
MKLLIWLREAWNHSLKCERLGHDWKQISIRGWQWPAENSRRHVADSVIVTIHECQRCRIRERKESDEVKRREGITSLSMPTPDWERLKERGFIAR